MVDRLLGQIQMVGGGSSPLEGQASRPRVHCPGPVVVAGFRGVLVSVNGWSRDAAHQCRDYDAQDCTTPPPRSRARASIPGGPKRHLHPHGRATLPGIGPATESGATLMRRIVAGASDIVVDWHSSPAGDSRCSLLTGILRIHGPRYESYTQSVHHLSDGVFGSPSNTLRMGPSRRGHSEPARVAGSAPSRAGRRANSPPGHMCRYAILLPR